MDDDFVAGDFGVGDDDQVVFGGDENGVENLDFFHFNGRLIRAGDFFPGAA